MPQLPDKMPSIWISNTNVPMMKLYPQLCILLYIHNQVHAQNNFKYRLKTLLTSHSNVDLTAMGFPKEWNNEPLWK